MRTVAVLPEHLHLLTSAARPPPLDLAIRIIVELDPALRTVGPLVRVPVWDRFTLQFSCHRRAHRVIARALVGPVGQVEDLLVQPGGFLRGRRTGYTFFSPY